MDIKEKNRMRIVLTAVLIFISFFAASFFLPLQKIFAAGIAENDFDKTDVMTDLESSTVGGKAFNVLDYPKDLIGIRETSIINFVEYCYNYRPHLQHNYGLYVYVYNPKEIVIDTKSVGNKIQLAVSYNADGIPNDYEKFDLKFCSKSEDKYKNRFYKFRIVDRVSVRDNMKIVDRVNRDNRRYDVSGVELVTYGERNATEYKVSGTYQFTGYVAGYGADVNAESNLKSTVNELETIELDVKHTYYRTGVSALGKGHQNELNTVYFNVSNEILKKYGKLQKIKAEWYEYKTRPIVVLNNIDMYNEISLYVGKNIGLNNSDCQYMLIDKILGLEALKPQYNFVWNDGGKFSDIEIIGRREDFISYLFYTTEKNIFDCVVSSSDLFKYMENYTKSYHTGKIKVGSKELSADLFSDMVDSGRTRGYNLREIDSNDKFDMLSYDSVKNNWQKFWDYGFFAPNTSGDFKDVVPIYEVTESDMSLNDDLLKETLLISSKDINTLRDTYENGVKSNEKTFLFRFAQTDYFSTELTYSNSAFVADNIAYAAQETVFFDFDILQLTFNRDGVYHVIPVVSSPIDIVNDITPPLKNNVFNWLALIITLVILIIIYIIFSPFINPVLSVIFKAVAWVICLPFRLIAKLFHLKKSDKSDK